MKELPKETVLALKAQVDALLPNKTPLELAQAAQILALRGALEKCKEEAYLEDPYLQDQPPLALGARLALIDMAVDEALSLPVPEIAQAVQGVIETIRLIAGPIEFYTATGERSQQAAAQAALKRLDAAMGKKP